MLNKRGYISLMQIFILVLGVVAIAYALGGEIRDVSAGGGAAKDRSADGAGSINGNNDIPDLTPSILNPTTWPERIGNSVSSLFMPSKTGNMGGTIEENWEKFNGQSENIKISLKLEGKSFNEGEDNFFKSRDGKWYKDKTLIEDKNEIKALEKKIKEKNFKWGNEEGKLEINKEINTKRFKYKFIGDDSVKDIYVDKEGRYFYKNDEGKMKEITNQNKINELNGRTDINNQGFGAMGVKGFFISVGVNFMYAMGVYGTIKTFGGEILGLDEEKTDAFAKALAGGYWVGSTVADVVADTAGKEALGMSSEGAGFVAGAITAAVIYYATYEDKSQIIITYTCAPWEAPTGGENCELCNKQEIPCSEYQCKSLGQACELLNPNTNETVCAWVNKNDAKYPIITLNKKVLTPGCEYSNTASISPPDRGVKILYTKGEQADTSGCIPPFTPIQFGITTDEPSKCKISTERKKSFDDMGLYFGGSSTFKYNHTQTLILPDPNKLGEGIEIKNNGEFSLYVRCADANGNYNPANYVFRYCVQKGPDLTAPIIRKTSLESGTPIAYNTSSIKMYLYTNEPATCKWDYNDKKYEAMQYEMESNPRPNKELLYTSSGEITGIRNDAITSFYFRCKDSAGNSNQQSKKIDLIGTMPLKINSVEPNNTIIKDSVSPARVDLVVKTTGGYEGGKSICYYSASGNDGDYEQFGFNGEVGFKTINTQDIYLPAGDKTYYIKCIDKAGNEDVKKIQFTVDEDKSPPQVARIYKEGGYLKLITNEKSSCVYDTKTCNYRFEQGINMSRLGEDKHFVDWDTNTNFYIKCQDEFKNRPSPSECTIIVKPTKTLKQT